MPTYIYSTEAPKIIQSRGSSSDSRASYDSTSSTEQRHASSKSSMGYYGGSQSKVEKPVEHKYRDPHADNKYIVSKTRGNVEVIDHRERIVDPQAPLSRDATSEHYRKEKREHGSSRHSSHKHSSHRR